MKRLSAVFTAFLFLVFTSLCSLRTTAQATAPEKSARAAALSDVQFIAASIGDNEDVLFLSKKALDHATDTRVKEVAQQLQDDHSVMLYSMQQLQAAGTGSSGQANIQEARRQAAALNSRLSSASGAEFDTVWVSNLLNMHQVKYETLTQAKETVTNPQLKMAITEAIPLVKKDLSQLKAVQKYLAKIAQQKLKEAKAKQANSRKQAK